MKLDQQDPNSDEVIKVVVTWNGHRYECMTCRDVDIEKSATYGQACVLGSKLIMEELVNRQRPTQAQKNKEVEEWAKKAGVFKVGKRLAFTTKYVGDEAA